MTPRGEGQRAAWSRKTWATLAGGCLLISAAAAIVGVRGGYVGGGSGQMASAERLPELPSAADHWVNGLPVSVAGMPGKALLIEAWHPA
ncbi:MAG: hypothetical protein U0441_24285 [Polyangiaceae bacterium]